MALLGNIQMYDSSINNYPGDDQYTVTAGTTASITAGTPVSKPLGQPSVSAAATNTPVVATDFYAGIAATTSNETASVAGTVMVTKMVPGQTWLIAPKVAATWDTQAEYDALVGDRVLLDLTSSTWTILASDGATNGCVIMPMDITLHPGMVRFAFRSGVSYLV